MECAMEINTAVSAYAAQQQQTLESPSRPGTTSTAPVQTAPRPGTTQNRGHSDHVAFSNEALHLSAQSQAANKAPQVVSQAGVAHNANPYPPQTSSQAVAQQAAGAQSVAQAINAYHDTLKY
jgi:hypothetical protein